MNIKQAKERFTMWELLALLGFEPDPKKSKGTDLWYISPFRPGEEKPSFHIDTQYNIWKDFGLGEKGGDLIAFAQKYLENNGKGSSVSETLKWFRELDGTAPSFPVKNPVNNKEQSKVTSKVAPYHLLANTPLKSTALFQYLKKRKISFYCAKRHLRQLFFIHRSSKKKVFGFGFENRAGDYDFSNPLGFKSCLGKKDISFIAGAQATHTIEVFEGFMDYLTRLTIEGKTELNNDVVVLNSTSMVQELIELSIDHQYQHMLLWLDNDPSGHKASNTLIDDLKESETNIRLMNEIYHGYKDLNQWHMDSVLTLSEKTDLISELIKTTQKLSLPELTLTA